MPSVCHLRVVFWSGHTLTSKTPGTCSPVGDHCISINKMVAKDGVSFVSTPTTSKVNTITMREVIDKCEEFLGAEIPRSQDLTN